MWIEIDECVGCPDGCRNCGRKHLLVLRCDGCQEEKPKYSVNNGEYCEDCLTKLMIADGYDDMDKYLEAIDGYEMVD